ncbi:MAG: hypothetical protein LQ345_003016 [Seirophora villosa]|nr:MAG: hypothetical protein LQ345_003016 [Seirophora villosa]
MNAEHGDKLRKHRFVYYSYSLLCAYIVLLHLPKSFLMMEKLPPELILQIAYSVLDLDAFDIVKLHYVSRCLRTITRDKELWKRLCFDDSASALSQKRRDLQFIAPSVIRDSATVFALHRRARALSITKGLGTGNGQRSNKPRRDISRPIADWDPSYSNEEIDWYGEYVSRHAPVSMSWLQQPDVNHANRECRGLGKYDRDGRSFIIAPLDDGSLCVWNLGQQNDSEIRAAGSVAGRSNKALFSTHDSPTPQSIPSLVECISVDKVRDKAHVAANDILFEVDLETLQVSSSEQYPFAISALSDGSRLASLTSIPHPLLYSRFHPPLYPDAAHTLIACGEYNGKGSLELYPFSSSTVPNLPVTSIASTTPYLPTSALITPYKNRTSASRSKLLSVTPHGTRLVHSDGDGGLKWVERDGHSLVRRWNINAYNASTTPGPNPPSLLSQMFANASNSTQDGGNVVRKILPVGPWEDAKGELAVWTGEKIGVLGFRPKPRFEWEWDQEVKEGQEEKEFRVRMRRALERQADDVRFVKGLGLGG